MKERGTKSLELSWEIIPVVKAEKHKDQVGLNTVSVEIRTRRD